MPRPNREVFNDSGCLLPELAMIGQNHATRARVPGLDAHAHNDAFEIFYMERGEADWWNGDERHRVVAGQIYINRPAERHGSVGTALGPCSYFWLQLNANRAQFLPHLPASEARAIFRVLSETAPRCFAVSPEISRFFQILLAECRQPGPLGFMVARANLHLLLAQIARDAGQQTQPQPTPSPQIHQILHFMNGNLESELSIAQLATQVELSVGHFRERFRAETGFTPHAYLTRQRIEAAKPLLAARENTIAAIGRRFGFCSSQHFATVFKKLEGISPSQFRETQESGASLGAEGQGHAAADDERRLSDR